MKTAKEKALEVAFSLTAGRVEALEGYMRGYLTTFERIKPFETARRFKLRDHRHGESEDFHRVSGP